MKSAKLPVKLLYIFFAFGVLIFGASSFFTRNDTLLIPGFISFIGLSAISAVKSGKEGDKKGLLLFSGACILFIFITAAMWIHMGL